MTQWTVARQAPLFTGFPRQEYWIGLPLLSPGDLSNPGIEHTSPACISCRQILYHLSHLGSPLFYTILWNTLVVESLCQAISPPGKLDKERSWSKFCTPRGFLFPTPLRVTSKSVTGPESSSSWCRTITSWVSKEAHSLSSYSTHLRKGPWLSETRLEGKCGHVSQSIHTGSANHLFIHYNLVFRNWNTPYQAVVKELLNHPSVKA